MSRIISRGAIGVLTLAVILAPGSHASAQSSGQPDTQGESTRPFRGLFRSGSSPTSDRSLILSGSIYGGWDSSVLADQPGLAIDTRGDSTEGTFGGGTLGIAFSRRGRRVDFGFTGNTSTRWYPQQQELTSGAYTVGAGANIALSRRTRLGLNQSVGYQPFYQLSLFPGLDDPILGGAPVPSNLDFVVNRSSGWIYDSAVNLDRQLSRRSNLSLYYRRSASDFEASDPTAPPAFNVNYQVAGFRFTRDLARGVALRLGYGYRTGNFANTGGRTQNTTPGPVVPGDPTGAPPAPVDPASEPLDETAEAHEIDVGVNYGKQLSFSRRTTFSFSTGTSLFEVGGDRTFTIVGDAALRHQFSRSWLSTIAYNRSVGFITNFSGPVLSDNVSARLDGLLGERVMISFQGGLSGGQAGYGADENEEGTSGFKTYTGTATMEYAFTANLASFVQYAYFYYDFPRGLGLPVAGEFDRNSIRVGLSVSVPLLR
jgi:hypothetical protein